MFENENDREVHTEYYIIIIIDGQNFFDQPVKRALRAYDKI